MVGVFVLFIWFCVLELKLFLKIFHSGWKAESIFGLFNFFMLLEWAFLVKSFQSFHSAFIMYKFRFLFNSLLDSVVDFICHWLISMPNLCNKKIKGFFFFWVRRWEGKFLEAIQVSPSLLFYSFPATTNVSFLISVLTILHLFTSIPIIVV